MQEEMNTAMAQLNESVGADVPSFAEVEQKIQARYAKAKATAELTETSVESRVWRSSRPPPTSRPRAASASCAPSSAWSPAPPQPSSKPVRRRAASCLTSPSV